MTSRALALCGAVALAATAGWSLLHRGSAPTRGEADGSGGGPDVLPGFAPGAATGALPAVVPPGGARRAPIDGDSTAGLIESMRRILQTREDGSVDWRMLWSTMARLCTRPDADRDALAFVRDELVPALLPALADSDAYAPGRTHRDGAIQVLGGCAAFGPDIASALVSAWRDASPALRAGILRALLRIDEASLPARDELRALVGDDPDLSAAALDALHRRAQDISSEDVDAAVRALDLASREVRVAALALLTGAPPALRARAADRVAALWDEPDHGILTEAVFALVACAPERARAMGLDRMSSTDPALRRAASWALAGVPLSVGEQDALLSMLSDPDGSVRGTAANALLIAPGLKERSVPRLREHVDDPHPPAAYEALATLSRLDPDGAVPDLERALASPNGRLRALAVVPRRFIRRGPDARSSTPSSTETARSATPRSGP